MKELITKEPFNFSVIETMEPVELTTLSFMDRAKLYCEVEAKSFYLRGRILQSIKEDKCYKDAGYKTFEKAVKDILDISRSFAYRIMGATNTYEILSPICRQNLPTTEAQLRPLIELLPEQQIEVWQEVAKDKVPTAKEVQAYVNEKFPKEKKPTVPKPIVVDNSTTTDTCTVDTTKYITIEEHRAVLAKIIAEFEEVIATLSSPDVIVTAPVEKLTKGIARQKVFEFVQKHGNEIQCTVLKDEHLTNEKLFKVFTRVREQYKAATPPPAWDMEIVNAEFIQ